MPISRDGITRIGGAGPVSLGGDLDMNENDIVDPDLVDGVDVAQLKVTVDGLVAGGGFPEAPDNLNALYLRNGTAEDWQTSIIDGQQYGLTDGYLTVIAPGGFVGTADQDLEMASFSVNDALSVETDTVVSRTATDLLLDAPAGQVVKLGKSLNVDGLEVVQATNLLVNTSNQSTTFDFAAVGLSGDTVTASTSIEVGCGGHIEQLMSYLATGSDLSGGTNQSVGSEEGQDFLAQWPEADLTKTWTGVRIPFDLQDSSSTIVTVRCYQEGAVSGRIWQLNSNSNLEADAILLATIPGYAVSSGGAFPLFDLTSFAITMTAGKRYGWSVDATTGLWKHRLTDAVNPFTGGTQSDTRTGIGGPAVDRDHIWWQIETCPTVAVPVLVADANGLSMSVPILLNSNTLQNAGAIDCAGLTLNTGATGLQVAVTSQQDIGSNSLRFRNAYLSGDLLTDGINADSLVVSTVASALIPDTTNLRDLGSGALRYRDGFLAGQLNAAILSSAGSVFSGGTVDTVSLAVAAGTAVFDNVNITLTNGTTLDSDLIPASTAIDLGSGSAYFGGAFLTSLTVDSAATFNTPCATELLRPITTSVYDLGTSALRYRTLYATGVNVNSASTFSGTVTCTNITSTHDLRPTADSSYSLGTSGLRWATMYADSVDTPQLTTSASRVDITTSLFPTVDSNFNLGDATKRWSGLFVTNPPVVGSDITLKENVVPVSVAASWELLDALPQAISYNWVDGICDSDDCRHVSWSAQDVAIAIAGVDTLVNDELVSFVTDETGPVAGTYGLSPSSLTPHLVAVVKDLKATVAAQQTQMDDMAQDIVDLNATLTAALARLDALEA